MQDCRDLLGQRMKECRNDINEIKERISNLKQLLEEDRQTRERAQHAETINQIARRRQAMIGMAPTGAHQQQQQSVGDAPSAGEHLLRLYLSTTTPL